MLQTKVDFTVVCRNCHASHEWTAELTRCPDCRQEFSAWDLSQQIMAQAHARHELPVRKEGEILH